MALQDILQLLKCHETVESAGHTLSNLSDLQNFCATCSSPKFQAKGDDIKFLLYVECPDIICSGSITMCSKSALR